jgi:signal transduction histidine kinase
MKSKPEESMYPRVPIAIVSALAVTLTAGAAGQTSQYGTSADAKAMLEKAVAAVKANKAKALEQFNKGEGGFKDRDLQPFCFNISDGKLVAATVPSALGKDVRELTDKTGKVFGKDVYAAAADGKITEVSYMFPRPGSDVPVTKVSFVTRVGELGCGVGYFKD